MEKDVIKTRAKPRQSFALDSQSPCVELAPYETYQKQQSCANLRIIANHDIWILSSEEF